jgi:hypothetical protein
VAALKQYLKTLRDKSQTGWLGMEAGASGNQNNGAGTVLVRRSRQSKK